MKKNRPVAALLVHFNKKVFQNARTLDKVLQSLRTQTHLAPVSTNWDKNQNYPSFGYEKEQQKKKKSEQTTTTTTKHINRKKSIDVPKQLHFVVMHSQNVSNNYCPSLCDITKGAVTPLPGFATVCGYCAKYNAAI